MHTLKRNYGVHLTTNLKSNHLGNTKLPAKHYRSRVDTLFGDDEFIAETDKDKAEVLNKHFSSVYAIENFDDIPLKDIANDKNYILNKLLALNLQGSLPP